MVNAPRKREGQQLLIRFPEGSDLRDRLDVVAKANNRSASAEIVHRLEMSLKDAEATMPVSLPVPDLGKRVALMETIAVQLLSEMAEVREKLGM